MWCVPTLDEEYIARMEEVLAVCEKPLSEKEPVVCVDEKTGGLAPGSSASRGDEAATGGPSG